MRNGRVIGIVLIVVGLAIGVLAAALLLSGVNGGGLTTSGALLGMGIAFLVLVAPLVGFGVVILAQGVQEDRRHQQAEQQRRLLDIVRSRGQVAVNDIAVEMQISQEAIRALVHKLVGLQVFSGYINWDKGILYSDAAQHLRELDKCRNCGGEIELAGKGVMTCKYCGTEYFIS